MAKQLSKKTIFCLICTFVYGVPSDTAVINAATNEEVTLKVEMEGEKTEVLWKHNGNKMVEWDKSTTVPVEFLEFQGRTVFDKTTGDVTILNLSKNDSGKYEAEVLIQEKIQSRIHTVKVYDPVTEAKITCNRSASMATLHCEAKGDSLSYSWSGPGLQTDGQSGPQISKEKDQDSDYICVVNNPVSKRTVLYHANDCFPSGNLITIIGVLSGVVVVGVGIGIVVGWYFYKKKSAGQTMLGKSKEVDSQHSTEKDTLLHDNNPEQKRHKDEEGNMSTRSDVSANMPDTSPLNFREIKKEWHRRDTKSGFKDVGPNSTDEKSQHTGYSSDSSKQVGDTGETLTPSKESGGVQILTCTATTPTQDKHALIEVPPSPSKDEADVEPNSIDEKCQRAGSSSDSSKQAGDTGETLTQSEGSSGVQILPDTEVTTTTFEKPSVAEGPPSASKDQRDVEPNSTDEKHQHAGLSSDSSKQSGDTGETLTQSEGSSGDQILPDTETTPTHEKHTVVEGPPSASRDQRDVEPNSTDVKHQHTGLSSDSSKQSGDIGETLTQSKDLSGDQILPDTETTPTHEKHTVIEGLPPASKDQMDVEPNSTDVKHQHAGLSSDSSKQFGDSGEPFSTSRNIPSDGLDGSAFDFKNTKDKWQKLEREMK